MRFLILGPLQVRGDDGVVALGGSKPRAVLAVLLLNANQAVSSERLALALWGDDAPPGATKTVHVHVSRLRKALGDADVITTSAAGYSLRVRPGELDAEQFERLVDSGRRALAEGRPDDAGATLREALALWRGPALAELAFEPFAQAEVARLEEQRLAALDARVAADLAAGRHAELVAELQQLVAANPTREMLAAHLMLALYRCGRQSDALAVYQSARRVLVDEIGVEPGPQLRELHEAVLRQDAALEEDAGPTAFPAELEPSTASALFGRDDELAWLRLRWGRARDGRGGVIVLAGAPGAGKTRLAAELAGEVHRGGASVLYTSASGSPASTLHVLRGLDGVSTPTLLVIDDADGADADLLAALDASTRGRSDRPLLVLVCCQDVDALDDLQTDGVRTLGALDAHAVRAIAGHYAPGAAPDDLPAQLLRQDSGGLPRRVHELAGQWARREVARRVTVVAGQAESERAQLRTIQDKLVGGVVELQAASERTRTRTAGGGHVVCPFKGLTSYEAGDAEYFFGRERLVAELVACLVGAPLFAIVGPSGSGKSSVLRAGLLPALASGVLPGSEAWGLALMRPGARPTRELAAALASVDGSTRTVLAVDQFEETFTVCGDEAERAKFISELVAIAGDPGGRSVVILALRADCYGLCAAYPELSALLSPNNVLVRSMQRDELVRAVEGPCGRAGLRIDPELVDALVADVEREPGGLPLLSTALLELWQRRNGTRLRHSTYEQMGGVRGAVARLAEDAFAQLDESQRAAARAVLMRLVAAGSGEVFERRRVALEELELDRDADLAHIVALLTDRRLLTVSAGRVEIAHEALLREWPRLRGWIEEDRDGLRIQRALSAAAQEWQRLGRDEGALYRGTRLREATEWRAARAPALNDLEREFLAAGEAASTRERLTRRRRTGLVLAAAGTVLLAAVGGVIAAVFADRQHDITTSRDLAAKSASVVRSDPGLALVIARAALARHDTEQAENALRQATFADRSVAITPAHAATAFDIAFSPDGRRLATAGEDGSVKIWRRSGGRPLATIKGHKAPALVAAFSPDTKRIVTGGVDGQIAVADLASGRRTVLLQLGRDDYATSLQFSPDGDRVLVATAAGAVGLLASGGAGALGLLGKHDGPVTDASFDRDGARVVSTSFDGSARIWQATGAPRPQRLAHGAEVHAASFSPDGTGLATTTGDGVLRLWDLERGGQPRKIAIDGVLAASVGFSADGRRLVTAGEDGVVRISDVGGGPPLDALRGHAGAVYDAGFVPGSDLVASVGEDGTLRTWRPHDVTTLVVAGGPERAPTDPSFSPDGAHVVSGAVDGAVRVWDPTTGGVTALPRLGFGSRAVYSADGRYIVSAGGDAKGSVKLWDVGRRRSQDVPSPAGEKYAVALDARARRIAIATLDQPTVATAPDGRHRVELRGARSVVNALAFSPDDKLVAGASADGTARIWEASDGTPRRRLQHGRAVNDVAFSPRDGRYVATAGADGTVRIWPASSGPPVLLYGHDGPVNSVAFDPTGRRVVSAGADGTVRLWSASGGEALLVLHTHNRRASGAAFSPDGESVVSAGGDGVLQITRCEVCGHLAGVLRLARSRATRRLDGAQRAELLADSG